MVRFILVKQTITQMIQDSALPQLHKNIYLLYLVDMNERDFGEEGLSIVPNTLKNCTVLNFGFLVQT